MKVLFSTFLIFFGLSCFAQFPRPDVNIETPKPVKFPDNFNVVETFGKPIKKKTIDKKTTEFDRNGNIIREFSNDGTYTNTTTYKYEKGILVEKITSKTPNSQAIQRENKNAFERASRENASEVAVMNDIEEEMIYTATLDKKGKIIAYQTEERSKDNETNLQKQKKSSYKVLYQKGKITEIKSENDIELFFYEKDLLIKRERTILSDDPNKNLIKKIETIDYKYDDRGNLIFRNPTSEYFYKKGSPQKESSFTYRDTASYDNKNRLVFHKKSLFSTRYEYDNQNRIISLTMYTDDKEGEKKQYFYTDDKVTKVIVSSGRKNDSYTYETTITYNFDNRGLLTERIDYTNPKMEEIRSKSLYEYNDKNQILKITELMARKNGSSEFDNFRETNYEYKTNILSIRSKYSNISVFEFFD